MYTFLEDQEPSYFPTEQRPKTTKAFLTLARRLPKQVELPNIVILAPDPGHYGVALRHLGEGPDCLIYLSPELEKLSQSEVDFTVAHEIVHAYLGHYTHEESIITEEYSERTYLEQKNEVAADELVVAWGYKIPARRSVRRRTTR